MSPRLPASAGGKPMISIELERLLPLGMAAAEVRRITGMKTHISTVYRWTTVGCRGVRLEFLLVGARRFTSREAISRFLERLTAQAQGTAAGTPPTTAARQRQLERIDEELDQAGIV
jgi:hypothetical protein